MRPFAASPTMCDHCGLRRRATDRQRASRFVGYSGVLTQPRPSVELRRPAGMLRIALPKSSCASWDGHLQRALSSRVTCGSTELSWPRPSVFRNSAQRFTRMARKSYAPSPPKFFESGLTNRPLHCAQQYSFSWCLATRIWNLAWASHCPMSKCALGCRSMRRWQPHFVKKRRLELRTYV